MRETSLVAWKEIQFALPRARAEAYRAVCATPGKTGRELELQHGLRHVNKRLVELERLGLVRVAPLHVRCSVTGFEAFSWLPVDLTETPNVDRLPPPRESWKTRALKAEAALEALYRLRPGPHTPSEELQLLQVAP